VVAFSRFQGCFIKANPSAGFYISISKGATSCQEIETGE